MFDNFWLKAYFTLLVIGFLKINTNIIKLCSGTQLSYLGIVLCALGVAFKISKEEPEQHLT